MKIRKRYGILFILAALLSAFVCVGEEEGFVYESKRRRDPFIPLITPEGVLRELERRSEDSDMRLEGIIFDESGESLAIINGRVVKVQDEVGGYTILKIEKDKVFLIKEGDILELGLNAGGKK